MMKGSLDGVSDPDNPFLYDFLPWALSSEILGPVTLLIGASSLSVTFNLNTYQKAVLKGRAIELLNAYLRRGDINDEVISSVIQLLVNEWYHGEVPDMLIHLKGLREIVRIRGGINNLDKPLLNGTSILV